LVINAETPIIKSPLCAPLSAAERGGLGSLAAMPEGGGAARLLLALLLRNAVLMVVVYSVYGRLLLRFSLVFQPLLILWPVGSVQSQLPNAGWLPVSSTSCCCSLLSQALGRPSA
jgi:hypothetical protein